MNAKQSELHNLALKICRERRELDFDLVLVLQEVEATKLYEVLKKPSLYIYAVELLQLSEGVAYGFNSVCKTAMGNPQLQSALAEKRLSVAKATRIVSTLNTENSTDLIEYACTHTFDEINRHVAKVNPKAAHPDRVKNLSEDLVQVTMCMSRATYEKLQRAESLEAQKGNVGKKSVTLDAVLEVYLHAADPVRKAQRAKPATFCAHRKTGRRHLTAAEKHAVMLRDQGRCTHMDALGKRCGSDRWVDIHHIRHVSDGGTNDPVNLTTLCSFHHRRVHAEPEVRYG